MSELILFDFPLMLISSRKGSQMGGVHKFITKAKHAPNALRWYSHTFELVPDDFASVLIWSRKGSLKGGFHDTSDMSETHPE